jgi:flavin-binding protein dodecin
MVYWDRRLTISQFIQRRFCMSERVYKLIEITGSSPTSLEDAIQTAVAKAAQTIRNMRWFEVVETRGTIKDGEVEYWQVTIKVGFTLDDDADA